MRLIKFSHQYAKLRCINAGMEAKLVEVLEVNLKDLSKAFLDYDTDNGKYKLPNSGKYLMLIFEAEGGLFTTLRSMYPEKKKEYYRALISEEFKVLINPKNCQDTTK